MGLGHEYEVDEDGRLVGTTCACDLCRDIARGTEKPEYAQGHYLCGSVPKNLLDAEDRGIIFASYQGNGWYWYTSEV